MKIDLTRQELLDIETALDAQISGASREQGPLVNRLKSLRDKIQEVQMAS